MCLRYVSTVYQNTRQLFKMLLSIINKTNYTILKNSNKIRLLMIDGYFKN